MAKEKITKNDVQELTQKLMELVGIEASIEVSKDKDKESGEPVFHVLINAENEAGLLIGTRGSTLHAIQSFLNMAIRQKTGDWVRIMVDIGDWRANQEKQLIELAEQAASRAKSTGEPQHLYNLSPGQRRVVHLTLSRQKGIVTESEGEGEGRYLVVKSE